MSMLCSILCTGIAHALLAAEDSDFQYERPESSAGQINQQMVPYLREERQTKCTKKCMQKTMQFGKKVAYLLLIG